MFWICLAQKNPEASRTKRKANPATDRLDALGPFMNEIGLELADMVDIRDGVFLYV